MRLPCSEWIGKGQSYLGQYHWSTCEKGTPPTTITLLMRKGYPLIPLPLRSHFVRGVGAGEIEVTGVVVTLTLTSGGRQKKKDGFSSKIQIPEFGGKKGHPHDVANAFRQWAHCITYYHEYYEDSYFMSLVVSFLTGDTSDMFNWTCSVSPGGAQDLSALLQMLREHYCGSFMF